MNTFIMLLAKGSTRLAILSLLAVSAAVFIVSADALANHSVIVEGESDFDGDGLIGEDEDNDGDQVFGTINGALGTTGLPGAINQNGRITIVTSGRFFEQVVITAESGIVVLEGAPGVVADIEAFNASADDIDANLARQAQPGVIVDSDGSFPVEIRNIVSRNWTQGIRVQGDSLVTIDNVKADSNVNWGINVVDNARVTITKSEITSSGFRNAGQGLGQVPANPGEGIAFQDSSSGSVFFTTVAHSFAAGISNTSSGSVTLQNVNVFNNNPDFDGVSP